MIPDTQRAELLSIARRAIEATIRGGSPLPLVPHGPLAQPAGAFVTLHINASLRGCIGHVEADRPLARVVAECAVSAATADPRFPRVTAGRTAGPPHRSVRARGVRAGVVDGGDRGRTTRVARRTRLAARPAASAGGAGVGMGRARPSSLTPVRRPAFRPMRGPHAVRCSSASRLKSSPNRVQVISAFAA